jgi:hypothetical protein
MGPQEKMGMLAGLIRGYAIDRMKIEVPVKYHDEDLPCKYYTELQLMAINRRKNSIKDFR